MPRLIPLLTTLAAAAAILAFGAYFAATSSSGSSAEAANQPPASLGSANAGAGAPDLTVTNITYGNVDPGHSCSITLGVTVDVANNGSAGSGSFVVDLNGVQDSTSNIPAGLSQSFVFTQQFFGSLTATADINNVVVESNEGNNTLAVPPFPTPTPTATCTPTAAPPTFTPTATDTGTPPSGLPDLAWFWTTQVLENPNCQFLGSYLIRIDNLGIGPSGDFYADINGFVYFIPSLAPGASSATFGWSSFVAIADSTGVVAESNESNNSLSLPPFPTPTPSPTCTATPTSAPGGTFTPTHSPTGTPFPSTATFTPTATPCGGPDGDGDGVPDCSDNCPTIANPVQENNDRNFIDNTPPTLQDDRTLPSSDPQGDACDPDDDNDGISDIDEGTGVFCALLTTTNPLLSDTDGDRFFDGMECILSTDPTNPASKPPLASCAPGAGDTDGDRISDRVEGCMYGTNPYDTDTDGDRNTDGATDGCEVASLNGDRVVNSGDQLLMVLELLREPTPQFRLVGYDLNKDGAVNSGDQLLLALFLVPGGQCPAGQPDLLIQSMSIELETGSSCAYTSTALGLRVVVRNSGFFQAPPFVVDANAAQMNTITTLAPGAITSMWFAGYLSGNNSAFADATFLVIESNEANNGLTQFLPIPTLPPTCTPTASPTNSPTVTHTPEPCTGFHQCLTLTPTPTPVTPTVTPTATPT